MIDSEMVGKRIRVNSLKGEPENINNRYAGRTGTIAYVDDIGQYHIAWDDSKIEGASGLAVIPGEDSFEILNESKAVRYNRASGLFEGKALSPEEKMDRWHDGKRKENIAACSDEKLAEYLKICRAKGYTEQVKIITAERKKRKGAKPVNESFDNSKLNALIADHDGLKSFKRAYGYDARGHEVDYDLKTAAPVGYIPADCVKYFDFFNQFKPMVEQILYCNDGGIIVISESLDALSRDQDPAYKEYNAKMRKRNDAFRDEYNEPHYKYAGIDRTATESRRKVRAGLDHKPWFSNW